MRWVLAATLMCVAATGSLAAAKRQMIGNWMLTVDEDHFSEGKKVIAMTLSPSGVLFAVRCIQDELSLAVTDPGFGEMKEGSPFKIKFRADRKAIVETVGAAINDKIIEIVATEEMRDELMTGREYALRLESASGASYDTAVPAGTAARALAPVLAACPADTD